MFQDITIEELLELRKSKELTLVDVRSPSEYAEATIPGSVNIPFFDDEERAAVGTLYKQVSSQAAKEKGLEIIAAKLPQFVQQFQQLPGRKAVFCWRGGMRSKSSATVLSLMDIHVYRLKGGVRAYRNWVIDRLEHFSMEPECIVLNGYTGTGKTKILRALAERHYPVLDLESMARHRGSIFGQVGLSPNNQKSFEAQLLEKLLEVQHAPYVLVEAESRRIGKVVLPEFLIEAKQKGRQIIIQLPVAERVRHIMEEYVPHLHKEQCLEAFHNIKKRIHTPVARQIEEALQQNYFEEAITLLLAHYYDPRYEHAQQEYEKEPLIIVAGSIDEAQELVMELLDQLITAKQ